MVRVALKSGDKISVANIEYIIDSVVGDGATCIVYSARYIDHAGLCHSVLLKECYPYADNVSRDEKALLWVDKNEHQNSLSSFKSAYEKLMAIQNTAKLRNSTSHAFDLFEANGTLYSVTDITEGTSFEKDKSKGLSDILKTVLALSKVVGKYHNAGYLHLDIKPSNFLVIPETRELVVLFDVDSVTSMDDIKNGKIKYIPYSKGWAAPEQMQGQIAKLCPATDIYSIGAILFQKLCNRDIAPADTGVFADWDFEDTTFDSVNPKIKRLLRTIFRKTLSANIKRRYQSADELISTLEEAVEVAEQKTYLLSGYIVSDINFVGRKNDLLKLDELFDNGTKAVFLHGFGGVGKTALATKYAELYGNKYDCIKFCRYSNGLKQIIDSLEIANASTNSGDEHRKLLKTVLKDTKTLIIIDNFDVEDDEELEYLLSLNCNVLFTTRNDYSQYVSSEKLEIIELESLPTDALVQVFKNEYGRDITDHEEGLVQDIIEKFGNLTLIVPMIAKQILSSHISIEEFASSIEGDVFARFNEDNEDIRIRKDGKSHKTNSLDYLRAMFNIAALSDEQKTVLQYLYLLRYHNDLALTTEKYKKYTDTNNLNALNDLAFKNWVTIEHNELKDEDHITVHQLIYDLVEKDFYPTYESVPGIAKYIEKCFEFIANLVEKDNMFKPISPEWDNVKHFTFALLMYSDIRTSDPESCAKSSVLNSFLCGSFQCEPDKLFNLLFQPPQESTWYFHVNGIMDMISEDIFDEVVSLIQLFSIEKSKELNNLLYNGGIFSFENENEKSDFLKLMDFETREEAVFMQYGLVFPYLLMKAYFHYMDNENSESKQVVFILYYLELKRSIWNETTENKDSNKFLRNILDLCFAVCKSPAFSEEVQKVTSVGFDINDCYEFYLLVFTMIQNALSIETNKNIRDVYLSVAEQIIILFDEQNDCFTWYGLSEDHILNYNAPSIDDYDKNKKLHWSKKADRWYDSVARTLKSSEHPYSIYKLLLSYSYQKEHISNSKINKLLNEKFIDQIFNDERLTFDQKRDLLFIGVVKELRNLKIRGNLKKNVRLQKKLQPQADLYFEALSKIDALEPNWKEKNINLEFAYLVDSAILLSRILSKELFNVTSYIESNITVENVSHIGILLSLTDKLRMRGMIKKSKELKNKIMDLCLNADWENMPEETIHMILYKVSPIAINYKRDDIVELLDRITSTIERRYHLELLVPPYDGLSFKYYEPHKIASKFMDDYIDIVAVEVYNKFNNTNFVSNIDEMERVLVDWKDILLSVTDIESGHYRTIFEDVGTLSYRKLNPYWALQFHSSNKKEVNAGLCYLIAMVYDCIPKTYFAVKDALHTLVETTSYTITSDELKAIVNQVLKLAPQSLDEINTFLDKMIEALDE